MEKEWKAIREWTNIIFSFHKKTITKPILEELKLALFTHVKQQYYTFKTDEHRSIIITFAQGKVTIKQRKGHLIVEIDDNTKQNVYALKQKMQESKQVKTLTMTDKHFDEFVDFAEETF